MGGRSVHSRVVASLPNAAMVLAILGKWAYWLKESTTKTIEEYGWLVSSFSGRTYWGSITILRTVYSGFTLQRYWCIVYGMYIPEPL